MAGLGSLIAAGAAGAWCALEVTRQRGAPATGTRLERMRRSPQWRDGAFRNRATAEAPATEAEPGLMARWFAARGSHRPPFEVPLSRDVAVTPPGQELNVTWFGHASALIELAGVRVLLDPVWSERCSPSSVVGPRRHHPAPVTLAELGAVDAVVISHDHYDHLDMASVQELHATGSALFVVPLGVGAHLERWGVAAGRIVECDWGDSWRVGPIEITCVESQHFSGRWLTGRDETLWASWAIAGPGGRVFFSGDTGYFDGYPAIRDAHGPFDLALMAIGAYDPTWRSVHLDPEEAVRATVELGSPTLLPIHWCTFTLAPHPWAEPVERLLAAARHAGVPVVVPRPGERVAVAGAPRPSNWWRRGAPDQASMRSASRA